LRACQPKLTATSIKHGPHEPRHVMQKKPKISVKVFTIHEGHIVAVLTFAKTKIGKLMELLAG
jgi:hypothetical protein